MTKIQKLIEKREALKLQITNINKQISDEEAAQKRKQQSETLAKIKASGLLDKTPEELDRLISLANEKAVTL